MKPSFFSGCHPEKIQIEFNPIFFRVAKALIFSKLKIGCRLKGWKAQFDILIFSNYLNFFSLKIPLLDHAASFNLSVLARI
jgi:hypothetical protein